MIALSLVVEFTIEPFVEGEPGPHVRAAVEAAEQSGVTVDFGPFGTTVSGDDNTVLTAVDRLLARRHRGRRHPGVAPVGPGGLTDPTVLSDLSCHIA